MSYDSVVEQIKAAPEACLDEISNIIGYVVFRYEKQDKQENNKKTDLSQCFGTLKHFGDGMEMQKRWRDEWS